MKNLPIVLYNAKSCRPRNRRFPLSCYSLMAPLRAAGFDPVVVDGNLSRDPHAEILEALGDGPALFGCTVMPGPQLKGAYAASKLVRDRAPRTRTLWGGYFPSMHGEVVLRSRLVDFVVKGRGEMAIVRLAEQLAQGGDGTSAPGVGHLKHDHLLVNPAPKLPSIDEIPQFDYTGVPIAPYLNRTYLGARTVGQFTSYGCAWACNFCAVTATFERKYQAMSPEVAVRPMHLLARRWGVDSMELFDPDFFISEARAVGVAEAMPKNFRWWGEGRVDEMIRYSDASWRKLVKSGLTMLYMGAESGSATVLKRMNKEILADQVMEAARKFKSYGVRPEFSFILGNPIDPETDARETIEFIRKVRKVNPDCEVILYRYTPMPVAGEMMDGAVSRGFRYPDRLEEWLEERWQRFATMADPQTPWLPKKLVRWMNNVDVTFQAYKPSPGVMHVHKAARLALKGLASWRYHTGIYAAPYEIKAALRLARYAPLSREGFPRA